MHVNRRDTFRLLLAGAAAGGLPSVSAAAARSTPLVLGNGLRAHLAPVECGYVSLALILRSELIVHQRGLAHIMEHTSFAGAAGSRTATEVAEAQKDHVQERNASTALGVLRWDATFLPRHLPDVIALLSDVTLDQKFDVKTVAREAKVVLEELYLEKYSASAQHQTEFEEALYGTTHPHVMRTLETEIATARLAPEKLAAELRGYAARLRLPPNMDLFIAGDIETDGASRLIEQHFGKFAYARGPFLGLTTVGVTRAYRPLAGVSPDLKKPLCEIKIGWNTGVTITDPDAPILVALSEYLDGILFKRLREQHGDTYTPEVSYQPDASSGIIMIALPSSKDPAEVEQRVFEAIDSLKTELDPHEAARIRDRAELRRRKLARSMEAIVDCMVKKAMDGAAIEDMTPETVTREELLAAARKYLPSHKGAYVRLALRGR